jgi:hypothetical protein
MKVDVDDPITHDYLRILFDEVIALDLRFTLSSTIEELEHFKEILHVYYAVLNYSVFAFFIFSTL